MTIPAVMGTIERRILINFRVEPKALETIVPAPFRLKLVRGKAIAGICLIRLRNIRPVFVPLEVGITSENAAHRIAIEWEENGRLHTGVYIPRRDSNSRFNNLLGGRIFPGVHHRAEFEVCENAETLRVAMVSRDKQTRVLVEGHSTDEWLAGSIFNSLSEASAFFQQGSLGYSPNYRNNSLECLELACLKWKVEPLEVTRVESSFFSNVSQFPANSVEFDCALVMRNMKHEWHHYPSLPMPEFETGQK